MTQDHSQGALLDEVRRRIRAARTADLVNIIKTATRLWVRNECVVEINRRDDLVRMASLGPLPGSPITAADMLKYDVYILREEKAARLMRLDRSSRRTVAQRTEGFHGSLVQTRPVSASRGRDAQSAVLS